MAIVTCWGSAIWGCRMVVVGGDGDGSTGVNERGEAWSRGGDWLVIMGDSCGGCGLCSTSVL